MSAPRFGVPVPQVFLDGRFDMTLVRESLARAEALGFDSAWVQDQVAGHVPLLESMSLLCYAAACTERMQLGVSVVVFPIRNAVQLAKTVASLDHMSQGRAILGIGLGPVFAGDGYFQIFGTRADQALRRFNEGLRVMRGLWTMPEFSLDGDFYRLERTRMEPKPVQQPHPPVWFGGQHPRALRRAAEVADGYMGAGPTTTEDFGRQVAQLRRFLHGAGRDPAGFPVSKRVYLALDRERPERAKARLDAFFGERYPWMVQQNPDFVADICVWGGPDQVAAGLARVLELGADMIVLNPLWDFIEQYEELAADVLPQLR